MKNTLIISVLFLILVSCYQGDSADLIIRNARIHKGDFGGAIYEAMAIKNGRIIEIGPERQILNKYKSSKVIDAGGRHIYPGLIDAHAHLISYADQLLSVQLSGSKSMTEVIEKCQLYHEKFKYNFIQGRGWDQSLWSDSRLPTNQEISNLYDSIPVCLFRIDGHAVLVNDYLLKKAGITSKTTVEGGEVILINNKPTGLLLDNAIELIKPFIPDFPLNQKIDAFKQIEKELFEFGITGIHEAGIHNKDISFLHKLIDNHDFKLNIYAMLYATKENFEFVEKNGKYNYKNLSIRSFKAMSDGALGSYGALLKKKYSDHDHFGIAVSSIKELRKLALFCLKHDYQMNTHCIGDSANSIVLNLIEKVNNENKNHRFRIEHAQVIDTQEFEKFRNFNVIPSVQPTHATSDMRWAENRIGKERMQGAYAYRTLLENAGLIVLGTDFPVEKTNPFLTIHSSVQRKNEQNQPTSGFMKNESLTLYQTLLGMTYWPAYASFDESNRGNLVEGKIADFVIMEQEINSTSDYSPNFSWKTFIGGEEVYSAE